ncbi:histidine N-alpha-methyltransferase [Actinorhabdospora filicis]|uniref:Histidine N-alpha-methyltransferase n=1 Tax=Actinorhabdospora filicis TaxID=1785913 RepID=A0A9W6WAK6_9ACTN|nr:L-histidine N(alpha)-methyltransferase [Actinorhabdospora filicis]GLZ78696.1 histidine N-alpha-methyltransferase [Actinorhabdospora filicis]
MTADVEIEEHLVPGDIAAQMRGDVLAGLGATPKWLPPKWFYDDAGSALFEEITRLPEYYPTRAEREILTARAPAIAAAGDAKTLVELGSGSSEKTLLLLDALRAHGSLARFVPLDVSGGALREAATRIAGRYPGLEVHGIVGDFTRHLQHLPMGPGRLIAFLGGTIGNLDPGERAAFLSSVRAVLEPGEALLLGADLVKDPATLVAAYDDATGVTAEFNRNVLRVLNHRLGADFDPAAFDHVAVWDAEREWIEMRLRSRYAQDVAIPGVGLTVSFAKDEDLRTEISAKFRREGLTGELAAAGFTVGRWWTDAAGRFALALALAD